MNLDDYNRKELITLKKECEKRLKDSKKDINDKAKLSLEEKINNFHVTDRVLSFFSNNSISSIPLLSSSMKYLPSINYLGSLTIFDLLYDSAHYREVLYKHGIRSKTDYYKIMDPNKKRIDRYDDLYRSINDVQRISYLLEFFGKFENIYNYQSTYNVFSYIVSILNKIFKDNSLTEEELMNKDYLEKKEYINSHIKEICSILLDYRDSIPGAKLSLGNASLSKLINKKSDVVTFNQGLINESINFGTTLEKLKANDFESAKSLIFIPYKKTR